jgi:hypothetical protein
MAPTKQPMLPAPAIAIVRLELIFAALRFASGFDSRTIGRCLSNGRTMLDHRAL